jgi:hypothetical protein
MLASPAFAFDPTAAACGQAGSGSATCTDSNGGADPLAGSNGIFVKVTHIVALLGGITAVVMIIAGGFMYVLSGGDSNKVSSAKSMIVYSAVGLVVIALAQTIIVFVLDRI